MVSTSLPGGTWTLGDLSVTRFGYGAMQLAGPWALGPPADHDGALAVLREAVDLGITHIDTSNAYGPGVTNQLIREALQPYPETLHIVTKVGSTRDSQGGWPPARKPEDLRRGIQENLDQILDLIMFYWLPKSENGQDDNPLEDEVHIEIIGEFKRINFMTSTSSEILRYVLQRIRTLGSRLP